MMSSTIVHDLPLGIRRLIRRWKALDEGVRTVVRSYTGVQSIMRYEAMLVGGGVHVVGAVGDDPPSRSPRLIQRWKAIGKSFRMVVSRRRSVP